RRRLAVTRACSEQRKKTRACAEQRKDEQRKEERRRSKPPPRHGVPLVSTAAKPLFMVALPLGAASLSSSAPCRPARNRGLGSRGSRPPPRGRSPRRD